MIRILVKSKEKSEQAVFETVPATLSLSLWRGLVYILKALIFTTSCKAKPALFSKEGEPSNGTPYEVACYSRTANGELKLGSRAVLRTYLPPRTPVDLNTGFDTFVAKNDSVAHVETLVDAVKSQNYDVSEKADIVTYRNNLNKIALTPYNDRDVWELDACRVSGTVFLDIRSTSEDPTDSRGRLFTYYGYKFEQVCCSADPLADDGPVDANEEFCSMVHRQIGNHRVLLCAEIDCEHRDGRETSPLDGYVELKTSREPKHRGQWRNMARQKFLKFWVQSFLAGVPVIKHGFRNDDGVLLKVETLKTRYIPALAYDLCGEEWSTDVALNFLSHCLAYIRKVCRNEGSVFRIKYDPTRRVVEAEHVPETDLAGRIRIALERK
ncbi:hypothetical protein NDN08_001351 [Rhodosorus marinus]|uniref:Decapping nuclease n=1 Tax=Rhodosorus marinus TaxID=101924 RepID=A0AAV8UUS7_9RHOD|nr:hypothetical protein NDN08_001351 [Rhodosorus marinus]